MPTYSKETALYDTGAIASDIGEAAQTATNYIVADSSGIKIADANPSSATTYLHLASSFLDFIRGGASMLKAWLDGSVAKVRVGAESGFNTLTDNEGIKLRNLTAVLGQFTSSAVEFYDGLGNAASNIVAWFGADGAQIGRTAESHIAMDYHSLQLVDKAGTNYFHVSDLRDRDGIAELTERFVATEGENQSFELEYYPTDIDGISASTSDGEVTFTFDRTNNAVVLDNALSNGTELFVSYTTMDNKTKAFTFGSRRSGYKIGPMSFSAGHLAVASNPYSYAEGFSTTASGFNSHAEGSTSTASGNFSHAEGNRTTASGGFSHAEGYRTVASGGSSHAEGNQTTASGSCSHAEGNQTTAYGSHSHAEGDHTIARAIDSHVIGRYNIDDTDAEYAFIVGNGHSSGRSNAFTVDWFGNVTCAGSITATNVPVTLYDNASAAASAAATLSETAANFKRLTIMYRDGDGTHGSVDVWSPNGKRVALSLTWINGASTQEMYQRVRWVTISGTSIATARFSGDTKYRTGQVKLGATASVTNSDYISIVHVIGYR